MIQGDQVIRRTTTNKLGVVSVVIPRKFAQDLGLAQSSDVIIQKRPDRVLIRKLEVP